MALTRPFHRRVVHLACIMRAYFCPHLPTSDHSLDLLARCAPRELVVQARYTRRGGLDINPWRSTGARVTAANPRLARQ